MEYSEYLKSNKWKRLRARAIKRAKNKCQLCFDDKNLQVHHRTYQRLFNESLVDLTVLCERCHKHFHNILPKYKKPYLVDIKIKPDPREKEFEELDRQLHTAKDDNEVKKILGQIRDLSRQKLKNKISINKTKE